MRVHRVCASLSLRRDRHMPWRGVCPALPSPRRRTARPSEGGQGQHQRIPRRPTEGLTARPSEGGTGPGDDAGPCRRVTALCVARRRTGTASAHPSATSTKSAATWAARSGTARRRNSGGSAKSCYGLPCHERHERRSAKKKQWRHGSGATTQSSGCSSDSSSRPAKGVPATGAAGTGPRTDHRR